MGYQPKRWAFWAPRSPTLPGSSPWGGRLKRPQLRPTGAPIRRRLSRDREAVTPRTGRHQRGGCLMMRSMFSGVSGLRSHQTMMDVVGNNVANVSTPGYKASQATFQETLTQTVRGAAPGSGVIGGTNPIQIGLGTQVATVDGIFTQG